MSTIQRWIWTWIITMMISGCALAPAIRPVTDPTIRIRGEGFSALPPQGKEWFIGPEGPTGVLFTKMFPDKLKSVTDKYHTFVTGVLVRRLEVKRVNAAADFPKAVEQLFVSQLTEGRFRLISAKTAPFGPPGSHCSEYDIVQEERDNPRAPEVVLEISVHGFLCLDVSTKFQIDAFYSERKAQGSESFLDDELKRGVEGFLSNVVVTPLR